MSTILLGEILGALIGLFLGALMFNGCAALGSLGELVISEGAKNRHGAFQYRLLDEQTDADVALDLPPSSG